MDDKRKIAVLIDSDNISYNYVKTIFDDLEEYGVANYKRIYGDWSRNNGWKESILQYSLNPIQQYSYTTGKNATDSSMIIDAMDILYTKDIDIFCLVTSDSDFTRLSMRLREEGKFVIGMGESKTPKPFVRSCNQFKYLDLLQADDEKEVESAITNVDEENSNNDKVSKEEVTDISVIKSFIIKVIHSNSEAGGKTDLGTLGRKLNEKFSEFDVRYYGYNKLSTFIENIDGLILQKDTKRFYVSEKEKKINRKDMEKFIIEVVQKNNKEIKNMSIIHEEIKKKYPNFSFKEQGYNQFSKFLNSFDRIVVSGNRIKIK